MNLGQRFVERLTWLREGEGLLRAAGEPLLVAVARNGCEVEALLLESSRLAAALAGMRIRVRRDREADADLLLQAANDLSRRASYLLERLEVIEVDRPGSRLQMRSAPPRRQVDTLEYYELTLAAEDGYFCVDVRRWRKGRGRREAAPVHLTVEVIERFIDDVVASFSIDRTED